MSDQTLSWVALLTLMVHPAIPEPTVRGAIRSVDGTDETRGYVGWTGYEPPVIAGLRPATADSQTGGAIATLPAPIQVFRDGGKLRIEQPDGAPSLIVGEQWCWQFEASRPEPLQTAVGNVHYGFAGTQLLTRRDANGFAGTDFTRPTGPVSATTFLGRSAWAVELAPPAGKPYPIQLVVDAETGLVLQQRNDGFGSVDEWVEFVVGEPLSPDLFSWDGPVRTADVEQRSRRAEREEDRRRRERWFTDHVTSIPVRAELSLGVWLHEYDPDTGAFQASLGETQIGMIARRPRSDTEWDVTWSENQHRWSDNQWDWAIAFHRDPLTDSGLERLKRQLGST